MAKKYIDADKLKAEIERHIQDVKDAEQRFSPNMGFFDAKLSGIYDVLSIIDSLQQEQPCDTCTNDKGCVTCKDGELWEGKEQPSEDLKGAIREWVNLMVGASFPEQDGDYISEEDYRSVIRQTALHFYALGKQSKEVGITMAEEKKTTLEELSYNGTQVVRRGESTIPAFEKTCLKCGTKFIYISEAIKHDRDGDYVVCPCCGAFIAHQERPKTADFIPPKCASDAKCENISPKHSDSFTSLEEAAKEYVTTHLRNNEFPTADNAFIAGAEWQKEQMLKEAVEGEVYRYDGCQKTATAIVIDIPSEPLGDKVKIVTVKEDGK